MLKLPESDEAEIWINLGTGEPRMGEDWEGGRDSDWIVELVLPWKWLVEAEAAPLPGLALHQPHFPVGESDLHGAGEDRQLGEEGHRLGARGHQRHALRAVCCLPLRLSLQNLEDVLGQHLLGVKGLLCVSSDSHRSDRHPSLHLLSLLQPVHPVILPEQKCPFL
ncbi:uncharacterized protein LOC116573401 isoform X1 [Mustela erminea]|uniref:uncharacterized protein LOC116573401 isoform X1 n=1 Tax=Mustela erminea TaxID=36723 RepID=UPI0013866DBC|nr:uncharacterized protein LOC116573401 isoform X1 [Mustela erminea]